MEPVRIAVIGCGSVSRGHIRGWLEEPRRVRVVALVDLEREQAEERRDQFGLREVRIGCDWREEVAREDVDAVNVCTQGHLHGAITVAAMEAGKHVMTEKPLGWTLEECRQLRWYAATYPDVKVAVAYSLRYYQLNLRVRELLREGAIGQLMHLEATHNHPHDTSRTTARPGWSHRSLADHSGYYVPSSELSGPTHVFDLMRYLGGEVRDVFAFNDPVGTFALMRFWSGAVGKATAATASNQGLATPHVLCAQGTEGTIYTQRRYVPGDPWSTFGYHGFLVRGQRCEAIDVPDDDTLHGDRLRTANFLDALEHNTPLIAPLEDAVGTSELLHAIRDSQSLEIRVPVHQAAKTG